MRNWKLNLQLFGEGDGAAAAPGSESAATLSAVVADEGPKAGQTLADGTQVDSRLAERMERQRKRYPERQMQVAPAQSEKPAEAPNAAEQIEAEWNEVKKGKYAEQYGRDVQAAVNDRFKNQRDATELYQQAQAKLDGMQPMLDALMHKAGVNNLEDLQKAVLDDDSLYEEEAEAHGMTVEAYKSFKKLEEQAQQAQAREAELDLQNRIRNHYMNLQQQAEKMRGTFPDFDLNKELEDPNFRRLTGPDSGLTVEQAYYALHHAELAPQAMMAGIRKAQNQISQSIQANAQRPVEGAMQNTAAANIGIDPRRMTKEEREEIKRQVRLGKKIVF